MREFNKVVITVDLTNFVSCTVDTIAGTDNLSPHGTIIQLLMF